MEGQRGSEQNEAAAQLGLSGEKGEEDPYKISASQEAGDIKSDMDGPIG